MPRHVFIHGTAGLLASHLAALSLSTSEDTVFVLLGRPDGGRFGEEESEALVRHAVRRLGADGRWEQLRSRLHLLRVDGPDEAEALAGALRGAGISEAWYLGGGYRPARAGAPHTPHAPEVPLRRLLSVLPRLGLPDFNLVGPQVSSQEDAGFAAAWLAAERDAAEACRAAGIGFRLFRTEPVIGACPPVHGADREGGLLLMSALHELQGELEERHPGYLGSRPLRCQAPPGASLGLVRVEQAAGRMLELARAPGTLSRRFHLTASERVPFARLCERLGAALGVNLQATESAASLNAVEQDLRERLSGFHGWLVDAPGEAAEEVRLDGATHEAVFQSVRQELDALRAERRARAAAVFSTLGERTVDRGGAPLRYFAGGPEGGTPLVLLNALGQGLFYWRRLVSHLLHRHRVLIWEPRGIDAGPRPFLLGDQVDDLEAVLRNEGIGTCHLVGWCTGPKVAVEFYLRRPASVGAMVFLNGSFRCASSPKTHQTAYEHNFEPLCGILARRPAMAGTVLKSLRLSMTQDDEDLSGVRDADAAGRVLARMNRDLKPHVLAPFRSEPVIVDYARQIVDFWSHDPRQTADRVLAPVLLISAEHDAVASPETSREMAARLPNARHVHLRGATHYCLYDRPELVAELIEDFLGTLPPSA